MNSQTIAGVIAVLALAGCPRHEGSADGGIDAGQQQTTCDNHGGCDVNAQCVQRDGGRLCICYPWYAGDGLTCSKTGLQAGSPWPIEGGNIRHTGQSPYVGPQTDHLKWSVTIGKYGGMRSLNLDANSNIYVGTVGDFRAVDSHGAFLWDLPTDPTGRWFSSALASDGTLYVQGDFNQSLLLYALDTAPNPQGKRVKWSVDLHDVYGSSPCVGADGTVYVGSSTNSSDPPRIYALGPGSESSDAGYTWALQTTYGGYGLPAIGDDGTIYVSDSRSFNAIDPQGSQGHLKWSTPIRGDPRYGGASTAPVIAPDGTIYIGSYSGLLYAIDPATGASKSRQIMDDMVSSLALGADGTLYVGGSVKDKALVALTPSAFWDSGAVIWRKDIIGGAESIVLGADGTIYITSGWLRALSPDGSLKWSVAEPLAGYLSEPAIAADGTLYIADSTSKLYAFGP
jgi:outer membrane protein assembly factor BamB